MNTRSTWSKTVLVLAALWSVCGAAAADQPADLPAVDGVTGFGAITGSSWFAIRFDYPDTSALTGVLWYNNDGLVTYPEVLVGAGHPDSPGPVSEMSVIAQSIQGGTSAWSELEFSEPVGATLGGVYVVFELPDGEAFAELGEGGGPGFGYRTGEVSIAGWASSDGEQWIAIHQAADYATVPLLIPLEEGMMLKSLGGESEELPVAEPYLAVAPNPFNPATEVRFGLTRAAEVKIQIHDVRGRRVLRLVDEQLPAGRHRITWTGADDAGRQVASGVYFARMEFGGEVLTRKLTLVR